MADPSKRSSAIAGFVSTAVLTSSDGLFGDNVEEERITDAPAPREITDASDYKPLFERLQEMKDKKDSDWKEKNNPFAPPKALDDEEFEFIRGLEERQAASTQRKNAQHEQDLAQFLLARDATQKQSNSAGASQVAGSVPSKTPDDLKKKLLKPQDSVQPMVVVRVKRKAKTTDANAEKKAKTDKQNKPAAKPAAASVVVATTSAKPNVNALGLADYGSDSDSDGDTKGA